MLDYIYIYIYMLDYIYIYNLSTRSFAQNSGLDHYLLYRLTPYKHIIGYW